MRAEYYIALICAAVVIFALGALLGERIGQRDERARMTQWWREMGRRK